MNLPSNYKSLTKIATQYGKQLGNWMNFPVGKNAIAEFTLNYPDIENPVIVIKGRAANRGTWAHEKLAVKFLQWCNPDTVQGLLHQNIELKAEVEFQRTKIQSMLPFISDAEIQRQVANPMEQRMLSVANPQTDTERVIAWLDKYREDPMAEKLVKRLIEHPAQINPGYCYDKKKWGTKAAFDRACDRWEVFDRIIEMMRGNQYWLKHYGLAQITPIDLEKLLNRFE